MWLKFLGNYDYSIGLREIWNLITTTITSKIVFLEGYGDAGDCYYHQYIMKDIPAFKEEDANMLSKIIFPNTLWIKRKAWIFKGRKERYTKDWKILRRTFAMIWTSGRNLTNEGFLPAIFRKASQYFRPLEKAKAIYYYIQKKITWNGYYHVFFKLRC